MAGQLTTKQVLLLNNLMYMTDSEPLAEVVDSENKTVGRLLAEIDTNKLQSDKDYGSFMTGDDWKNLIQTVKNDKQLSSMKIVSTHIDNGPDGGGGASAVFVDPSTNEAVVAFRGTASHEWKDNFTGGGKTEGLDGVSTLQQENALEWYRSLDMDQYSTVTVTGHSKGGNKAKYVTVMDDSVDRCLSFDGQGFSDEFINKYRDQIAANQGKIHNNNVDSDYVNLLLNDIGQTTFYKGYGYGKGGFLENHCPNTFLDFHSDGTCGMSGSSRDERMAAMDEFLNNYLRTLSPEDKQKTLTLIGDLVEGGFNKSSTDELLGILLKGDNVDYAANLAAYLLVYKKEHPELVDTVSDILNSMGMENVSKIINTVDGITDWKYFDKLMEVLGWASGHIPQFAYDKLREYLEKNGIHLTDEQLAKLLSMLQIMADEMDDIKIEDNGKDLVVDSSEETGGTACSKPCQFQVYLSNMDSAKEGLDEIYTKLLAYSDEIKQICDKLGIECLMSKMKLIAVQIELANEIKGSKHMKQAISQIHYAYKSCEGKLIGNVK